MDWDEALKRFRSFLGRRKSSYTAAKYYQIARRFVEYIKGEGVHDIKSVNAMHVEGFYDTLKVSDRSMVVYSYGLAAFFNFIGRGDLAEMVVIPTYEVREPPWLYEDEVEKLIEGTDHPVFKAMFQTAYECALRIGEAVNLTWGDWNPKERTIRVTRLKAKKRTVSTKPVSRKCAILIETLRAIYEGEGVKITDDTPLFMVKGGRKGASYSKMTTRTAERWFRIYAQKTGIDKALKKRGFKKATFHCLRHSIITHVAIKTGGDLIAMQKLSDHADPKNLLIYVHIANRELRERLGRK